MTHRPRPKVTLEGLALLYSLIEKMEKAEPLRACDVAEIEERKRIERRNVEIETADQLMEQLNKIGKPQSLSFLQRPDALSYLSSIDNDLEAQVRIAADCFADWLNNAEYPPPHYSYRIGVILRRIKEDALWIRFETAYKKHFPQAKIGPSRR